MEEEEVADFQSFGAIRPSPILQVEQHMVLFNLVQSSLLRSVICLIAAAMAFCGPGCASNSPNYNNQMVFDRPEDAAKRFASAAKSGDSAEMEAIFGSDAKQTLSSGDPVADRWNRQIVAVAMSERWTLQPQDATTRELVIGDEAWPFPIPLVKDGRGWWFDTAAGRQEVLARRIGRNELATIDTLRAYVVAQREYARFGRDGKPSGIYAQQIRSAPGRRNGLYWPVSMKQPQSPFGEFVAAASAEGYGTQAKEGAAPYHGYYYRILTSQGPAAPGGARDYVVNGEMTGGFAMIAFPAEYGNSGIMTLIVGPDGIVYESDLGDSTQTAAGEVTTYDPSGAWRFAR